ncbi:protein kinase C eta type-like [Xenopus laevis]|uniref:non-specific serine/threonine protein kinase n=1 Tax=Xenopus laevis TaxID=8355 RepID=A0A8J1MW00_XENLA|nr:protein kinase C eta type-like [Xenopus laevis]XP_041445498.1 protein kinase C eta type-like [Xenopus laevis]XP_041445499.1 protein kinase C eta type-like [Xenopus laevis]
MAKEKIYTSDDIDGILTEKRVMQITKESLYTVNLYATFHTKNMLFFVMEFAAGGSVRTHLQKARTFDIPRARFYAACITLGLEELHEKGIIHR